MLDDFTLPHETIRVLPIESAGAAFALPERDVIGVLALGEDGALEQIGGVLAMQMDDRLRPLVSLREALCQRSTATEQFVVVLRIQAQLFGLLVDQASAATDAVIHPTGELAPALATFTHVVRLDDGRDLPVLNPATLALTAQRREPVPALRLAA